MINMRAQLRAMIDRIPRLGQLSRADARVWARVETLPAAGELTAQWLEGGMETLETPTPEPEALEGGPDWVGVAKPDPDPEPDVLETPTPEPEPVVCEPVVLEPVVAEPVVLVGADQELLVAAAREWISDCTWPDLDAELLDELSPDKQECRPGLPALLTKEESVTAALEHEQEHGYERELPTPTVEVTELEVASEVAETPTPEPDVLETPELEPASGPLSPEPEALEGGPDWVGVAKPDPDPEPDVLEGGPELESGFCNPPAPTSTPVLEPPVPTCEKDRITGQWIDALNDGTHRQVHGAWEEPRFFGGKKECTIQVGLNSVDGLDSVHDVRALYGNELVSDVLDMNDIRKKPFSTISKVLEKELSPQYRQQRKDYGLDK